VKKEDFVTAFLEGAALAPKNELLHHLVEQLYDTRQTVYRQREQIEYMDEIARDNTISMSCRSCKDSYEPDCELSEMSHEGNYCGKNQWCCP
jgi:hypothetical protein